MMKIITLGDECLRRSAEPVVKIDGVLNQRIQDMFAVMYAKNGIGLAAPQVGDSRRLFVIDTREEKGKLSLINPKIVSYSSAEVEMEEGCLSVPGIYGPVSRSSVVTVEYLDEQGSERILKARDLLARVILHEYDHLEGTLFIDLLKPEYLEKITRELSEAHLQKDPGVLE